MQPHAPPPPSPPSPPTIAGDLPPPNSVFMTREEVLSLRSRRLNQLARVYRDNYWSLADELRRKHRDYYWNYGKSPFEGKRKGEENGVVERLNGDDDEEEEGEGKFGFGEGNGDKRCRFQGCRTKAMAMTSYCFPHILCDKKQVLYKGCKYMFKSGPTGQVLCGRPVLRSNEASLCPIHSQRAEKNVSKALKKAGFSVTASTKFATKFHLIVAENILTHFSREGLMNANFHGRLTTQVLHIALPPWILC
ncbi:hypothetical protein Droror1_Dr00001707 [Drosera rotundifolia]